jgi:putative NADH-flavin reductase
MSLKTIALFGANGQIGKKILLALLGCNEQEFNVRCFVPPGTDKGLPIYGGAVHDRTSVVTFDLEKLHLDSLSRDLQGVDAVVSALNGPALEAQPMLQDAAAEAGVRRFYPSEYGMHHIYRKPDDPQGYIHPVSDSDVALHALC